MYVSKTCVVSLLLSLSLAADHIPVTIVNEPFNAPCGGVTVQDRDIYNAVAYGMSLNSAHETLTSSDNNDYPSYYGNSEGFLWQRAECNEQPYEALQHYPVVKNGFFEDGNDAGKYRAVYWYNYALDEQEHPLGYYCGTIYHTGNDNSYAGCDVVKDTTVVISPFRNVPT